MSEPTPESERWATLIRVVATEKKMITTEAVLFNEVMQIIWGMDEADNTFIGRSVANALRGRQHFDPENALEVLRVAFNDAKVKPRLATPAEFGGHLPHEGILFDVTFADGSRVLIDADKYGNGHGIEYIDHNRPSEVLVGAGSQH